jgi:hypothetical protein
MLATKITNHVQQALQRLLQQYKGKARIEGFYTSFVEQIQDLEDAIYALDAGRQLYNGTSTPAVGEQLDQIGTIVGISRNGLSDAEYLLFIFGKIAENFSDSTIPTILSVIGYVFQAPEVKIQEVYPAGIAIEILGSPIDPSLYDIAIGLVQAALGAGVSIVFAAVSPTVNTFRFESSDTTSANGWGDVNNPATGGVFSGLI